MPQGTRIVWQSAPDRSPEGGPARSNRPSSAAGDALYAQGRFAEAAQQYAALAQMEPARPDHQCKLAACAYQLGAHAVAERHFKRAIELAPRYHKAHEVLSQLYFDMGDNARAMLHSAKAIELAPQDRDVIISRAVVLEANGQPEAAWQLIEPLIKTGTLSFRTVLVIGRTAPAMKRERDALSIIERFVSSTRLSPPQKAHLDFAAATLLDRLGEHDEAFALAIAAKKAAGTVYDPRGFADHVRSQIQYFTASKLASLPRASHGSKRTVFIIGVPRSGTTLVEQILACHPDVYGAGELNLIQRIAISGQDADWAGGKPYPDYLDVLQAAKADELAGAYLTSIASLNGDARYVTDKNPFNFIYLGLIATLFPEARVIHCVRNPLDTCVSCFMTLFGSAGFDFTFDLASVGDFYRQSHQLMRHWQINLGFPMLEVRYERMVDDIHEQTHRLLQFLDLPSNDKCLRFFENRRAVATPSYDQVRRPIYASSVGRWRRYEKHLQPLFNSLGELAQL